MYKFIKSLLLHLAPRDFIEKLDPIFRKVWSLFYKGNKVYCTICESSFSKFIIYDNDELLCPGCGSIRRKRLLFKVLMSDYKNELNNGLILHFTPNKKLANKLKGLFNQKYIITDYLNANANKQYDITNIECKDDYYGFIICYHIFEHIINDIKGMEELYRVLKKGGIILLQVPFKSGDIYEDYSITSDEDRLREFGQIDHVRIYSIQGFTDRLVQVGFKTKIIRFNDRYSNDEIIHFGFNPSEIIIECRKE